MSKLVSKLEAGSPSLEFPGRASIRASTTLNVASELSIREKPVILENLIQIKIVNTPDVCRLFAIGSGVLIY